MGGESTSIRLKTYILLKIIRVWPNLVRHLLMKLMAGILSLGTELTLGMTPNLNAELSLTETVVFGQASFRLTPDAAGLENADKIIMALTDWKRHVANKKKS